MKLDPLKKLKRISDECQVLQQEITKILARATILWSTPQVSESELAVTTQQSGIIRRTSTRTESPGALSAYNK